MEQTIYELKPGSFIFNKKNALPGDVCNEIIERFEANLDDQYPGRIGQQAAEETDIKRSTDLVVSNKSHWGDIDKLLFSSLNRALNEFKNLYPFFKGPFKDMGYSVQRTNAGEFYHWHIDGGSHEFSHRQLVAIWYLNDLAGSGGNTQFRAQEVSVQPEAGKLVLFPPFWTHEHRGETLQSGSKYIATTWVVFS
jgi:Rps23 Pro-64 3,4-dihydroxylase Tpa1-like proline 4-hydroxylase